MIEVASEWRIAVDGAETSVLFERAREEGPIFVCAHGAGGHMRDRGMNALSEALRDRGVGMVRFNFLYREQGSRRPDPMPRLERCMGAVVEHVRRVLNPRTLLIGGRSMGGRTGSMLAASGLECDGLLLFAYPLHPAGQPQKLRDAHLPKIAAPVLCLNGTRDALCRRDLMEAMLERLGPQWTMHWVEGADHGFHVLKSSGRTDAQVMTEIAGALEKWLRRLR
jgi:predicted alpha/beta-hydrolase family hydrolase